MSSEYLDGGEWRPIYRVNSAKKLQIAAFIVGRKWAADDGKIAKIARCARNERRFPGALNYKVELAGFHTKVRHMSVALPTGYWYRCSAICLAYAFTPCDGLDIKPHALFTW